MVPSQAIADEYVELLGLFNTLANTPRAQVVGNLVKALGHSETCRRTLLADRPVYAVVKGNGRHQGYYIKWCVLHLLMPNCMLTLS